ncbi:hypothetical protein ES708_11135 [subsurface metagenome]
MDYQWNPIKAKSNYQKHGVYFSDAEFIFEDALAIKIPDDCTEEERFAVLGMDAFGRILVVVYTWRDDDIRIISARKATPGQCKWYEEKR